MKVRYLKNFPVIEERNEKYYLFSAFVDTLSPEEVCSLFDTNFNQDLFKRKIFNKRFVVDVKKSILSIHNELVEDIFNKITSLDTYHKKEAASVLLAELFPYLSQEYQEHIIDFFLCSEYKNNRKRGYQLLNSSWQNKYSDMVLKCWEKYDDSEILFVIVNKLRTDLLEKYIRKILETFNSADLLEYDFELRKLRNSFYAKFFNKLKGEILRIKKEDPISYIDIYRLANKKIDSDLAFSIYKRFPFKYRYLPKWYAQMGLWDVLVKINNANLNPKIKPRYPEFKFD